ncbi:MAG: hypothetical protein ACETWG_07845 [Candidatus Neomarinimicrobiota bacterium]
MGLLRILSFVVFLGAILFGEEIPRERIEAIKAQLLHKDEIFQGRFPEYTRDGVWTFRDDVNWLSGFIGGELMVYV